MVGPGLVCVSAGRAFYRKTRELLNIIIVCIFVFYALTLWHFFCLLLCIFVLLVFILTLFFWLFKIIFNVNAWCCAANKPRLQGESLERGQVFGRRSAASIMVDDFFLALVVSAVLYGSAAVLITVRGETPPWRYLSWQGRLWVLAKAVDMINFANALAASVLSSWELYQTKERFIVTGSRSGDGQLADSTLGIVCGYITVEIILVTVACFRHRKNSPALAHIRHTFGEMLLFHAVAFLGLSSVVLRNSGYPIALWVVWSELTSVFIGLENFTSEAPPRSISGRISRLSSVFSNVLFIIQRVVMFYYLLWLSWRSFVSETWFVCQTGILLIGTLLNTHMAWYLFE